MGRDVVRGVLIIDPQAGETCLSTKDDGPDRLGCPSAIVLVANGQIDLHGGSRAAGLLAEIVREVAREVPSVAVNVDDHGKRSRQAANGTGGRYARDRQNTTGTRELQMNERRGGS